MGKGTVTTKVIDRGHDRIMRQVDELARTPGGPHVKVGVLEAAGDHKDGQGHSEGLTVVDVAVFNEFGAQLRHGRIPERAFMRTSAKALVPIMSELGARLLAAMVGGKTSLDRALDVLGLKAQAVIKNTVRDWELPPNAPSTILKKAREAGRAKILRDAHKKGVTTEEAASASGYNNPLEDTGQLRNSIQYVKVK